MESGLSGKPVSLPSGTSAGLLVDWPSYGFRYLDNEFYQ